MHLRRCAGHATAPLRGNSLYNQPCPSLIGNYTFTSTPSLNLLWMHFLSTRSTYCVLYLVFTLCAELYWPFLSTSCMSFRVPKVSLNFHRGLILYQYFETLSFR